MTISMNQFKPRCNDVFCITSFQEPHLFTLVLLDNIGHNIATRDYAETRLQILLFQLIRARKLLPLRSNG